MSPSYLVDTDWIIHYLNGNMRVVEKLRSLKGDGLGISIISLAELYEGIYYSTDLSLKVVFDTNISNSAFTRP